MNDPMAGLTRESRLKPVIYLLGYMGLVPFVTLTISIGLNAGIFKQPHFMMISYAAVILTFMGAIYWGTAMSMGESCSMLQLLISIVIALLGWTALLLPTHNAYQLLLITFIALCVADHYLLPVRRYPRWYMNMRVVLTTIVVLCLTISAYHCYTLACQT